MLLTSATPKGTEKSHLIPSSVVAQNVNERENVVIEFVNGCECEQIPFYARPTEGEWVWILYFAGMAQSKARYSIEILQLSGSGTNWFQMLWEATKPLLSTKRAWQVGKLQIENRLKGHAIRWKGVSIKM